MFHYFFVCVFFLCYWFYIFFVCLSLLPAFPVPSCPFLPLLCFAVLFLSVLLSLSAPTSPLPPSSPHHAPRPGLPPRTALNSSVALRPPRSAGKTWKKSPASRRTETADRAWRVQGQRFRRSPRMGRKRKARGSGLKLKVFPVKRRLGGSSGKAWGGKIRIAWH